MGAMYKGFLVTAVLAVPLIYLVTQYALGDMNALIGGENLGNIDIGAPLAEEGTSALAPFTGMDLFWCSVVGLLLTGVIIWITEYYTGTNFRPVRSIAKASETGHGTNVIQGLAISLEIHCTADACHRDGHHRQLPARWPDGHCLRRHRHAGAGWHGRGAGCLWSCD